MGRLSAIECFTTKPDRTGIDRLLGDGGGLFLRIRTHGTRTWMIEYVFEGKRRRFTIGILDKQGAAGESISSWLDNGRLSLAQARAIAGQWKADRQAGRDPIAELDARLNARRAAEDAQHKAIALEAEQPTVREAVELFAAKHLAGKKSASEMRYRLDRLVKELGDRKLRDLARKDVVAALERIAEGQIEGRTAKLLAGEVLVMAKRLWRFAATHEWIEASCIEILSRKDIDARPVRRNVALRLDELAILWRALADPARCKSDDITVAALRLLILTGQREREVTDAEWTEIANPVLPGVLGHYNHNEYLPQREAALKAWAERIEGLAADQKVVQFQRPAA